MCAELVLIWHGALPHGSDHLFLCLFFYVDEPTIRGALREAKPRDSDAELGVCELAGGVESK